MANHPPPEGIADDFFERIFPMAPSYGAAAAGEGNLSGMLRQLSSREGGASSSSAVGGAGLPGGGMFPLALSLEQGKGVGGYGKAEDGGSGGGGTRYREEPAEAGRAPSAKVEMDPAVRLASPFPAFGHVPPSAAAAEHLPFIRANPPQGPPQVFHGQPTPGAVAIVPHPPAPRPRVRARRGQATDPHSIAERLRRERIAERIRALQELVPNTNKRQSLETALAEHRSRLLMSEQEWIAERVGLSMERARLAEERASFDSQAQVSAKRIAQLEEEVARLQLYRDQEFQIKYDISEQRVRELETQVERMISQQRAMRRVLERVYAFLKKIESRAVLKSSAPNVFMGSIAQPPREKKRKLEEGGLQPPLQDEGRDEGEGESHL